MRGIWETFWALPKDSAGCMSVAFQRWFCSIICRPANPRLLRFEALVTCCSHEAEGASNYKHFIFFKIKTRLLTEPPAYVGVKPWYYNVKWCKGAKRDFILEAYIAKEAAVKMVECHNPREMTLFTLIIWAIWSAKIWKVRQQNNRRVIAYSSIRVRLDLGKSLVLYCFAGPHHRRSGYLYTQRVKPF